MPPVRAAIEALQQSPITQVALPRIGDPDIIPLWFGEGDTLTADFIREAATDSLEQGHTFYVHPRGRQELRDAIRRYLHRLYGVELHPDRITVPGAAMLGITMAAQMSLSPGAHAIIVGPAWPNIHNTMRVTGADVEFVRKTLIDGQWMLDMQQLKSTVRPTTRAIFVNSPCNPTGWVMPESQIRELLEFCRARNILIIADEVYHRHVFDAEVAPSFLTFVDDDDPVIVINSFSKAWAMTGWRLGWMVTPRRYGAMLAILSECFNTGSTVFTQAGGIAALDQGEGIVRGLREQYARGRDIVLQELGGHPRLEMGAPHGGFYVFPRVRDMGMPSLKFAERMADEAKVGVAPGSAFGPGNEDHFRICYARSHEQLREALRRVVIFLDGSRVE